MNATQEATALRNSVRGKADGAERLLATPTVPASWMSGHMARGVVQEMMHYTSQRMRAYAQHLEALTQCETMQAAAERQMEFLRESQSEIANQLGTIMKLAQAKPATNGHS